MEVTFEIPKNDYVQPTEVSPDVVKAICEAFLAREYSDLTMLGLVALWVKKVSENFVLPI